MRHSIEDSTQRLTTRGVFWRALIPLFVVLAILPSAVQADTYATSGNTFWRYDPGTGWPDWGSVVSTGEPTTALAFDSAGLLNVAVGEVDQTIIRYDVSTNTEVDRSTWSRTGITDLAMAPDGTLHATFTDGSSGGYFAFDPATLEIVPGSVKDFAPCTALTFDSTGLLYVAVRRGPGDHTLFQYNASTYDLVDWFGAPEIFDLTTAPDGTIYAATPYGYAEVDLDEVWPNWLRSDDSAKALAFDSTGLLNVAVRGAGVAIIRYDVSTSPNTEVDRSLQPDELTITDMTTAPAPNPIPEPSTLAALLSMGLAGLVIAWRRRKRK